MAFWDQYGVATSRTPRSKQGDAIFLLVGLSPGVGASTQSKVLPLTPTKEPLFENYTLCLRVTTLKSQHPSISDHRYENVFEGKHNGQLIALKVLYKGHHKVRDFPSSAKRG